MISFCCRLKVKVLKGESAFSGWQTLFKRVEFIRSSLTESERETLDEQNKPYGFKQFIKHDYGIYGRLLSVDVGLGAVTGVLAGLYMFTQFAQKDNNKSNKALEECFKWPESFPLAKKMKALKEASGNGFNEDPQIVRLKLEIEDRKAICAHLDKRFSMIKDITTFIDEEIGQHDKRILTFLMCMHRLNVTKTTFPKPLRIQIVNMAHTGWEEDTVFKQKLNMLIKHEKNAPVTLKHKDMDMIMNSEELPEELGVYRVNDESTFKVYTQTLKNKIISFEVNRLDELGFFRDFKDCKGAIKKRKKHLKKTVDYYSDSSIRFLPARVQLVTAIATPVFVLLGGWVLAKWMGKTNGKGAGSKALED